MIKYLGSKRTLVPVLGGIAEAVGAETAVDLFTGTTRVAQEFKRRGLHVTALDTASYAEVLARCYIETDARSVDVTRLRSILEELAALPGRAGYVTRVFCEDSRYFQPHNGQRIDAIREHLADHYAADELLPILLTALLLAADRVDSTTGVQMAYLKQWAPRSYNELDLKMPEMLPGSGRSVRGDALELIETLPPVDLAYLDPPYNQHRYFTNYHVWETLIRWDAPEAYGVARKRIDSRDPETKSAFNSRRQMPDALASVISRVRASTVVVSYNNESWVAPETIVAALRDAGHEDVALLGFDRKRYVGAQIGIHNVHGDKVGRVSHLRNIEYVFVAGRAEAVARARAVVPDAVQV